MSAKTAKLQIDGIDKVIELPLYEGTTGPDVLDVRGLVSEGVFTYDPGFVPQHRVNRRLPSSTAAREYSSIAAIQ